MKTQSKRRTSILVGLALMGLSVNGYAAEVSATPDSTGVRQLLKLVELLKAILLT